MSADDRARVLVLLESLCQLDLYKVKIYAETLLEIHGGGLPKPQSRVKMRKRTIGRTRL